MLTDEFKREERYIVFKHEDAHNYLSSEQQDDLSGILDTISDGREAAGKSSHNYVVVADDWPEYEPTWKAIEARVTGRAIEAEVRAEAQEPVAWFVFAGNNGPVPLELWGFDLKACKNAVLENARSVGWKGTVEGYLFQKGWAIRPLGFLSSYPPAPCPKCAESEKTLQSIAEHVDWAFIGDLDDVVASRITERNAAIAHFAAERDALQAKVADLTREVAQWKNNHATVVRQARVLKERTDMPLERVKAYEHYGEMIEMVAELEALNVTKIRLDVVPGDDGMGEEIYAKSVDDVDRLLSGIGERNAQLQDENAQQAALIEKCEKCLTDLSGMGWADEALAAIAAHRSQS